MEGWILRSQCLAVNDGYHEISDNSDGNRDNNNCGLEGLTKL